MVTFEEAYAKAKKLKADIDGYTEWTKGYVFWSSKDAGNIGGPGEVVILKKDGRAIGVPTFMLIEGPGEIIKEDVKLK